MQKYLIILQSNNLETRKIQAVKCKPSQLLHKVIEVTGKNDTTIFHITTQFLEIGWNLTVIDLQTHEIIE